MHKIIAELPCSNLQRQQLQTYVDLLLKWNKAYNLTAITNVDEVMVKHILDSLSIVEYVQGDNILDIGTGAGLPGMVLAIVMPDKQFTLLDSNGKKVRFLQQVIYELQLTNVKAVQARVEAYQPQEIFDCITSRAFTDLHKMLKLTRHLQHSHTIYLAMKAKLTAQELSDLGKVKIVDLLVPYLKETRTLAILGSLLQNIE